MDLLDHLLEHDDWATTQLLDICQGLTDEQLDQQFDIGHRTVRETLHHFIENPAFWAGLMTGQPVDVQPLERTLSALTDLHKRNYPAFATLARQLRDEQRLDETYLDHYQVRKSMGGTIIMVILHNTEHRVEVLHILERLGVPDVPELDSGVWDYPALNT